MSPVKPSSNEEEYYLRNEAEKLKAKAEQVRRETRQATREELKQLHWMRCPKCGMELTEIEYRGIQLDKCFSCGGVYLDDGELEQIADSPDDQGLFAGLTRVFGGKNQGDAG
jgi:hypothetical protein